MKPLLTVNRSIEKQLGRSDGSSMPRAQRSGMLRKATGECKEALKVLYVKIGGTQADADKLAAPAP